MDWRKRRSGLWKKKTIDAQGNGIVPKEETQIPVSRQ